MKMKQCKECLGTGVNYSGICKACKGKGYIRVLPENDKK